MKAMFQTWPGRTMLLVLGSLMALSLFSCESTVKAQAVDKAPADKEYSQVDTPPKPQNLSQIYTDIGYPKEAVENNIQGRVFAKILVGTDGLYIKHEIMRAEHEILESAVTPHLDKLIFSPGMVDGKPVKAWVTLPFTFKFKK